MGDIMSVIGFHFRKLNADKKKSAVGKINVSTNITLMTAKEAKISMGASKKKGVEFSFSFKVNYEPGIGDIELNSAIVYIGTEEKIKAILDQFGKEKKIPADVAEEVYNYVLDKSNVEALMLAREMQLPSHLPMPKITGK